MRQKHGSNYNVAFAIHFNFYIIALRDCQKLFNGFSIPYDKENGTYAYTCMVKHNMTDKKLASYSGV